jgi:hypothetical protein
VKAQYKEKMYLVCQRERCRALNWFSHVSYSLTRVPMRYRARAKMWPMVMRKRKEVTRVMCYLAQLWSMNGRIF